MKNKFVLWSATMLMAGLAAAQNVGIGTTTPQASLEVSTSANDVLKVTSTRGAAGNHSYIDFLTYTGTSVNARIGAIDMGSYDGSLVFETGNQGTPNTTTTERMRILNTGYVGIGITVPATNLHIIASSGQGIALDAPSGSQGYMLYTGGSSTASGTQEGAFALAGASGAWSTDAATNDVVIRTNSSQHILFNTNAGSSTSTMALYGAKVGIGTVSPGSTLDVRGNINLNQNEFYISGNNDNNHHIIYNSTYDGPELAGCHGVSIATPCFSSPLAVFYEATSTSNYTVFTAYCYESAGEYYSHYYNKYLDVVNDLDSIDHIRPVLSRQTGSGEAIIANDVSTYPSCARALTPDGSYSTNVGGLSTFNTGAIRELRRETKTEVEALNDKVARLENIVSQLTGKALGEMEFTAGSVAYKDVDSYYVVDARIKASSEITITGLSGYTIINKGNGGFGIRFDKAPAADVHFTYSSRF